MDTRMIEVAIGLALVFALFSLLVSAVQEVWTSMRGQRGKILGQAIVSFVGDDPQFAKALQQHPLIVSLAQGTVREARNPSYMGADVIVTSLVSRVVEQVMQGVRPSTPAEWVAALKAASKATPSAAPTEGTEAALPNAQFVSGLSSLLQGVEHDWPAFEARICAWYDSVGQRSQGWFKRWTQRSLFVIALVLAAAANIDPIVIANRLWSDEPLRRAMVVAAEQASQEYTKSTASPDPVTVSVPAPVAAPASATASAAAPRGARQLPTLIVPALQPLRLDAAQAVETRLAQLVASLLAAVEHLKSHPADGAWQNANAALKEATDLRKDLDLRRIPDDQSILALRTHANADASIDTRLRRLADLLPHDALHEATHGQLRDLGLAITRERKALTDRSLQIVARCEKLDDPAARNLCLRLNDISALQSAGLPIGWSNGALPTVFPQDCEPAASGDQSKTRRECTEASEWARLAGRLGGNWVLAFIGWCLCGIAATLGAPFWFDMLGKLVKLRGSGGKPESGGADGQSAASGGDKTLVGDGMLVRSASSTRAGAEPDTTGDGLEPMQDALNEAERSLSSAEIQRLQRSLGMPEPDVSGRFDATTRRAVQAWQSVQQTSITGELTADQIRQLLALAAHPAEDGYVG